MLYSMRSWEQLGVEAEVRKIADRYDVPPSSYENLYRAIAHKHFMRAIEPLLKMKLSVVRSAIPSWTMNNDGTIEIGSDGITDDLRASLTQIDELIMIEAKKYGITLLPSLRG